MEYLATANSIKLDNGSIVRIEWYSICNEPENFNGFTGWKVLLWQLHCWRNNLFNTDSIIWILPLPSHFYWKLTNIEWVPVSNDPPDMFVLLWNLWNRIRFNIPFCYFYIVFVIAIMNKSGILFHPMGITLFLARSSLFFILLCLLSFLQWPSNSLKYCKITLCLLIHINLSGNCLLTKVANEISLLIIIFLSMHFYIFYSLMLDVAELFPIRKLCISEYNTKFGVMITFDSAYGNDAQDNIMQFVWWEYICRRQNKQDVSLTKCLWHWLWFDIFRNHWHVSIIPVA